MFELLPMSDRPWGRILRGDRAHLLDLPDETVADALREFGVLLFRGFRAANSSFAEFADRFCVRTLSWLHGGQNRREVPGDDRTSTVNLGRQLIGPHAELAYSPQRPDLLWFACSRPPASRGETTVFDGTEIWSNLPDELREDFCGTNLRYHFPDTGPETWPLFTGAAADHAGTVELLAGLPGISHRATDADHIDIDYVVPAALPSRYQGIPAFANSITPTPEHLVGFADGRPIPMSLRLALLKTCTRSMVRVVWQSGDVMMIDNSRMMHGRMPFDDPNREIYVRMGMAAF